MVRLSVLLAAVVVAVVLVIAAVTLIGRDEFKDIDLPDTAPAGTGDNGTTPPPPPPPSAPPPPLGTLHVLAVIFYTDGTQETVSADSTVLTVFNAGNGKAIARMEYTLEFTAGRNLTVFSAGNTYLMVRLVSTVDGTIKYRRVTDLSGDKPMTPGQRLFILSASVYAGDLSAAPDGGYRLSYNLTFMLWDNTKTPPLLRKFYVVYPSIDISIQTAVTPPPGGGGGGGSPPRRLAIYQGVDQAVAVTQGA